MGFVASTLYLWFKTVHEKLLAAYITLNTAQELRFHATFTLVRSPGEGKRSGGIRGKITEMNEE